ncbi:MAG: hypothetical protein ACT6FG_04095 [Methanosarcinaceae archaeon]
MMDISDGPAMSLHDVADAGGVGYKVFMIMRRLLMMTRASLLAVRMRQRNLRLTSAAIMGYYFQGAWIC